MKRLAGAVVALLALGGCGGDGTDDAEAFCWETVESNLKSPGSAEFERVAAEEVFDGEWEIAGTVDSENSFGGLIRTRFACRVVEEGDELRMDEFEAE